MACRPVAPSSGLRDVGLVISLICMPLAVTFLRPKSDSSSVNLDGGNRFINPSPIVWLSLLTSADCRPTGGQPDLAPLSSVQSRSTCDARVAGAKLSVPFQNLHNVDMGQGSYLRMLPFAVPSAGHALSRPLCYRKAQLRGGRKPASRGDQRLLTGKHLPSRMGGQPNHVCRLKHRGILATQKRCFDFPLLPPREQPRGRMVRWGCSGGENRGLGRGGAWCSWG